jgi:hypothetical protein
VATCRHRHPSAGGHNTGAGAGRLGRRLPAVPPLGPDNSAALVLLAAFLPAMATRDGADADEISAIRRRPPAGPTIAPSSIRALPRCARPQRTFSGWYGDIFEDEARPPCGGARLCSAYRSGGRL